MAFDGITLHSIVNELQILINGKINQIYQPNSNNITISIYSGKNYLLNIDTSASNYRIHVTNHSKQNPLQAPNFCMLLRKYLTGSRIEKIYLNGLERVCYIDFDAFNEMNDKVTRTLIVELMGKYSNIILTNEDGTIIDALKKFDVKDPFENSHSSSRSIMPTRKYFSPVDTKKDFTNISFDDFENIITNSDYKTLEKAIPNIFTGISKVFLQCSLEKLHISNNIGHKNIKEIYNYINHILNDRDHIYCSNYGNNYSICFDKEIQNDSDNLKINNTIDELYYEKTENEYYIQYRNTLLKVLSGTLDKLTSKLNNINSKIASCGDMEKYKLYGELLIANIYKFDNVYEDFVEVENYYSNNENTKIKINPNLTISQNAEKYFKKYNKMKNTIRISEIQKKETKIELNYLSSLIEQIDYCNSIEDIDEIYANISENILFNDIRFKQKKNIKKMKKDDNSLNNYIKLQINGFDVFIGKNNKQNDYLTTKVANDNDLWFHTKDIHGSHLILKSNGETPKLETLNKCASLAAYYSKAKFSSHVPVDYTLIKNVKKPNGAVPGYVIYTNNKTLYVDPSNQID